MTLARELEENNQLAASFFFDKRVTQETSSALDMFISSLARQISRFDLRYHHALGRTLMSNPDIVKDSLELQARQLLIAPFSAMKTPPLESSSERTAILIFDALDECGSSADLTAVLRVIALLDFLPPNYRILFTSRPHPAVLLLLSSYSTGDVEDLDDPKYQASAGEDILRFIETEFNDPQFNIRRESTWPPSAEEVNAFSVLSQGLFELAALRVRRIQSAPSKGLPLKEVFDVIKDEARGLPAKRLEDELQAEYIRILGWAYPSHDQDQKRILDRYRLIVGTFLSLREPLGLDAMARILGMGEFTVRAALSPLSSVFFVDPDSSVPIRCYHATFREFLFTILPTSTEFHRNFLFDGPEHLSMLRLCVERLSQDLRPGLCSEIYDYDTLDDIPDFDLKMTVTLPPHLRYCCLHWSHHLPPISSDDFAAVEVTLETFFGSCLLNWIEGMSLLRETNGALSILRQTVNWYRSQVCFSSYACVAHVDLRTLQNRPQSANEQVAREAHAMLAEFLIPIRANPQHLHQSALPQMSQVPLLQQRYLRYHSPAYRVFGDPFSAKSESLHWKVDSAQDEDILGAILSPTNINILIARWNRASRRCYLDLRRMEDGSVIRSYLTPHRRSGIGMGFLSGDGDAVVSWERMHSECFVYEPDRPPLSVMDKMGWQRSPYLHSLIAATEHTLALWEARTPNRPCIIDTTTWTEAPLRVPDVQAQQSTFYNRKHGSMTQLAFAKDSASLIAIYGGDLSQVLVWNWKTRDLVNIVSLASSSSPRWELYLFPKSPHTTLVHFAILHRNGTVHIIRLAGAPLRNGTNRRSLIADPHELLNSPPTIDTYDILYPLPRFDHIALLSKPDNHPYPDERHVIAIVENQLCALPLTDAGHSKGSFLLSSTAYVVVQVTVAGLHGRTFPLRAESVRQATTISKASNRKLILSSAISQNGHFLACGYESGLLEVYDLDSGGAIPESFLLGSECHNPTFLAFVSQDTQIAIWGEKPREEPYERGIDHRILTVHLVKLGKDSMLPTKIGEVRWKPYSPEQKLYPPVISSALSMSMELEWTGDNTPHPLLTRFDPDVSYQQPLSFQPVDPIADYLRAFSPNNRYVGISGLGTSWVWSTSTGDPIYTVKGGLFGINHVPAVLRVLLSSPFPDPSQITYHAANPYSTDSPPPSFPPNGAAGSAATNWDSAVFVMLHELDAARNPDEYHRARISWRSNGFMVANAKTGYIRLDNGRLCWAHPSSHSSFHSDSRESASKRSPQVWVEKGGSRILLGGRKGVHPVVLDVGQ